MDARFHGCARRNSAFGLYYKSAANTSVIFSYLPEFDWIVAASSYLEEFYRPLRTIERAFLWLGFVSLGLLLIISFLLGAYFTRPIKQMMIRYRQSSGNHGGRILARPRLPVRDLHPPEFRTR